VLSPSQKGAVAEIGIAHHATRLGIQVYRPVAEGGRCDMIFDVGDRLLRVQCKWASRRDGVVSGALQTSRRTLDGYHRTTYSAQEVDAVALYCAELDKCYLIPIAVADGKRVIHLRLDPCKNNQQQSINWASQYELGAIAQLGERLHGMQEVAGSSPASSTT
jgi:hypothetical protein